MQRRSLGGECKWIRCKKVQLKNQRLKPEKKEQAFERGEKKSEEIKGKVQGTRPRVAQGG